MRALWSLWPILLCVAAQGGVSSVPATNDSAFLARTYTNKTGAILPYRLLPPKHYDPAIAYPVILYLHGAAARGSDNAAPLEWGPRLFLEGPARAQHEFFLVIPQCPRSSGWNETLAATNAPPANEPLQMALELTVSALPRQYHLDPNRRYITGVSMGGHGSWVALARQPRVFAAAVPVCAPGEPTAVTRAAVQCPVWVFHSDDDHLVPVQQAREMVKAWQARRGSARYTEYHGLQHSSWKKAYVDTNLFTWLFAQKL